MIQDLYQELILDHNRSPKNFFEMLDPSTSAIGFNLLCGDKITLYLKIENGIVQTASFLGEGCAISIASASLLTESVKEKSLSETMTLFQKVHRLLTETNFSDPTLGKLLALSGVKVYPARVKCATLAWHTLDSALKKRKDVTTTE